MTPEQIEELYRLEHINDSLKQEAQTEDDDEVYRIKDWTTLFRRNLDIFNEDYLGIKNLCLFQKQFINTVSDNDISTAIASRGLSKSFNIGLLAVDFALLYSGVNILITSMTLSQSNNIIDEKINKIFCTRGTAFSSPVLCQLREDGWIRFVSDKDTNARIVEFKNGSKIFAVNCGESARGK